MLGYRSAIECRRQSDVEYSAPPLELIEGSAADGDLTDSQKNANEWDTGQSVSTVNLCNEANSREVLK